MKDTKISLLIAITDKKRSVNLISFLPSIVKSI